MKLPPFSVHRPESPGDASRLMLDLGDDAALYCGGTELLLAMKLGLADYSHLVDTKRITSLHVLGEHGGMLRIGAAVTHHELETSGLLQAWCPAMPAMLSQVANIRVRSTGTLGGNLCFADPHSDPATFLIAAGATLACQLGEETRSLAVADFFTGPYQTVLRHGELLTAIDIPALAAGTGLAHVRMRLHERPALTVAARIGLTGESVSQAVLVVGSVGIHPLAVAAAGSLIGVETGGFASRAEKCAREAAGECVPLDGGDCSPEYLGHLVQVHCFRALAAAHRAAGGASEAGLASSGLVSCHIRREVVSGGRIASVIYRSGVAACRSCPWRSGWRLERYPANRPFRATIKVICGFEGRWCRGINILIRS